MNATLASIRLVVVGLSGLRHNETTNIYVKDESELYEEYFGFDHEFLLNSLNFLSSATLTLHAARHETALSLVFY